MAICKVSNNHKVLFGYYICTSSSDNLQNIIDIFRNITRVQNICGAIDGTHIQISKQLDASTTPIFAKIFNCKKCYNAIFK